MSYRKHLLLVAVSLVLIGVVGCTGRDPLEGLIGGGSEAAQDPFEALEPEDIDPTPIPNYGDDPITSQGWVDRASVRITNKDLDGAQQDLDRALEIDDENADAYAIYAELYWRLEEFEDSIDAANTALEIDPENARAYKERGTTYIFLEDLEQALADLNRAIQLDPELATAYNNRGNIAYGVGDLDRAFADYNRAIQLDDSNPIMFVNRARIYSAVGEYEAAIADLNRAEELDQYNAQLYLQRGEVKFEGLNDVEGARQDFIRAVQVDPEIAMAWAWLGFMTGQLGELDTSFAYLDRATELDDTLALPYASRGYNYMILAAQESNPNAIIPTGQEHFDNAIAEFDQALELDPQFILALNGRAALNFSLENYEAALEDYDRIIEIAPGLLAAYLFRGNSHYYLDELNGALEDYDMFIDLQPGVGVVYYNRAVVEEELDMGDAALDDYGQFLDYYNEEENPSFYLADDSLFGNLFDPVERAELRIDKLEKEN